MSTGDKNTTGLLKGTILEPEGARFDQIVRLIKGSDAVDYAKKRSPTSDSKHTLKDLRK